MTKVDLAYFNFPEMDTKSGEILELILEGGFKFETYVTFREGEIK